MYFLQEELLELNLLPPYWCSRLATGGTSENMITLWSYLIDIRGGGGNTNFCFHIPELITSVSDTSVFQKSKFPVPVGICKKFLNINRKENVYI